MSIVTQQMLEDRVGEAELIRLTDDAGSGAVNAAVLARAIDEGEGEILANVAQKYTLPLDLSDAIVAAAIKAKLLDAVVYRLCMHRDRPVQEDITAAYKSALAWSEKIAAGNLRLYRETEQEDPGQATEFIIESGTKVFGRDKMKGL